VFERLVLNHLDGIGLKHKFSIRGLTSGKMTWTIRDRIRRFNSRRDSDFIVAITEAVHAKNPLHLVPFSRNFVAVDSIICEPNGVLTCILVTVVENTIFWSHTNVDHSSKSITKLEDPGNYSNEA